MCMGVQPTCPQPPALAVEARKAQRFEQALSDAVGPDVASMIERGEDRLAPFRLRHPGISHFDELPEGVRKDVRRRADTRTFRDIKQRAHPPDLPPRAP